ncbi:hypothetical protein PMIN03_007513 [Paraphaeosphaeria minitans]
MLPIPKDHALTPLAVSADIPRFELKNVPASDKHIENQRRKTLQTISELAPHHATTQGSTGSSSWARNDVITHGSPGNIGSKHSRSSRRRSLPVQGLSSQRDYTGFPERSTSSSGVSRLRRSGAVLCLPPSIREVVPYLRSLRENCQDSRYQMTRRNQPRIAIGPADSSPMAHLEEQINKEEDGMRAGKETSLNRTNKPNSGPSLTFSIIDFSSGFCSGRKAAGRAPFVQFTADFVQLDTLIIDPVQRFFEHDQADPAIIIVHVHQAF